ncbi:MAG: hypothetical protein V1846_00055 [Candidatus Komeilibacteria bacterium]
MKRFWKTLGIATLVMIGILLVTGVVFLLTPDGKNLILDYRATSAGNNCRQDDYACQLDEISRLEWRLPEGLDVKVVRETQRRLTTNLWNRIHKPWGHEILPDSIYVQFITSACHYNDSALLRDVCELYFDGEPKSFQEATDRFNAIPDYYADYGQMRPWRDLTLERAIRRLDSWENCETLLKSWELTPEQKQVVLDRSLILASGKPLDAWWSIHAHSKPPEADRWNRKFVDNRWASCARDTIIARANSVYELVRLAPEANNRQIMAMVRRLNSWPNLTTENVVDWVSQIPDQSIAYRILKDQVTRRSNGDLVDAYNTREEGSPVRSWIIQILRQRDPSSDEWNEIYLRSKEGSRLMALAAVGSLRCN